MDYIFPLLFVSLTLLCALFLLKTVATRRRLDFISRYQFPPTISKKVAQAYPHLTDTQLHQVMNGLRDYFQMIAISRGKAVSMPSQVVDVAWHEFILFTRNYAEFCQKSHGRFIHHTPAEAMQSRTIAQEGIKRAWRLACHLENIEPKAAPRLPRIFALDARLQIKDGFHYQLDCMKAGCRSDYCANHIGCSTGCAGASGDDSGTADSGCGGGGCGGGD